MIWLALAYMAVGAVMLFMCLRDEEILADLREWPIDKQVGYVLLSILGWPLLVFGGSDDGNDYDQR